MNPRLVAVVIAGGMVLAACGGRSSTVDEQPADAALAATVVADHAAVASPAPRGVLPDLQVVQVASGKNVNLRDLGVAGKPSLLWFWAPHCPICRAEAPDLVDFAARHGDDVQIIGVGAQDDLEQARGFLAETGTDDLQMIWDASGKSWVHYGVTNQPTVIVLDPAGKVKRTWFRDFDDAAIVRAYEQR